MNDQKKQAIAKAAQALERALNDYGYMLDAEIKTDYQEVCGGKPMASYEVRISSYEETVGIYPSTIPYP